MDEQYLIWKDKKSEPFRKNWIEAVVKHEQLVQRFYDIFYKHLAGEVSDDQLVNARHDRDIASTQAYSAKKEYETVVSSRFTFDQYIKETGREV